MSYLTWLHLLLERAGTEPLQAWLMSMRAENDLSHFDFVHSTDVTSINHDMEKTLAHMHTQTPTHTHTHTQSHTHLHTPTNSLFFFTLSRVSRSCVQGTHWCSHWWHSAKKLKHRSGCPTMYIKVWLRKKEFTQLCLHQPRA
jgi:hypothetical protein